MKNLKGHHTSLNLAKRSTFFKTVGYTTMLMLLMVSIVGSLVPDDVFAVSNQNLTSKSQGNEVEQSYYDDSSYTAGVWVSAPGSAYGSTGVDVHEGQTSVNVVIRGSWSPRKRINNGNSMNFQGVYAKLKTSGTYPVAGESGTRSSSGGLSLTGSSMFYRGDKPGNPSAAYFTRNTDASDGQVPARLNVGTRCNGNYGSTIIMNVYIASVFTVKPNGGGSPVSLPNNDAYNYDKTSIRIRCIATSWTTTGNTTINRNTASVGQTVTWRHTLRNNGPVDITSSNSTKADGTSGVFVNVDREYWDSDGNKIGSRSERNLDTDAYARSGETFINQATSYTIEPRVVGGQVCERLSWHRPNNTGSNTDWGHTRYTCVSVPIQYEVYPNLQINAGAVQPGSVVTGDASVYNQGNRTTDVDWAISRVVIKRQHLSSFESNFNRTMAVTPNWRYGQGSSGGSGLNICAWLNVSPASGYDCADTSEDGSVEASRNTITQAASASLTIPTSVDYGDMVCFVLGISGGSTGGNVHRYAQSNCMLISKSPKIQVWGGDLRTAMSIKTSQTVVNNQTFGSWGEYGVMSSLNNSTMASAGGYQGGAASGANIDKLTFANRLPSGVPLSGGFGNVPHMNLRNQFLGDNVLGMSVRGTYSNTSRTVNGLSSGIYEASGTLRISGNLAKNRTIIIRPVRNSDNSLRNLRVVIDGNINVPSSTMANVGQVPQLIIIANDIDIEEDVTEVNAWLLTSGNINTCRNGHNRLTTEMCDKRLTINGPVETDTISLRRTGGSGTANDNARSEPAEVFNLRADASMWLYNESANSGMPITVNVRELPPRF